MVEYHTITALALLYFMADVQKMFEYNIGPKLRKRRELTKTFAMVSDCYLGLYQKYFSVVRVDLECQSAPRHLYRDLVPVSTSSPLL